MKNLACIFLSVLLLVMPLLLMSQTVQVKEVEGKQQFEILIHDKPFTRFNYPDSLQKPFLYPIYTPGGEIVTRGFPLEPRANEPIDHPHHIGLWLNYESVNGLDFWNNSYAIPPDKKAHYGRIKTTRIANVKSGKEGKLTYEADWVDINNNVLLKEVTTFIFSTGANGNIIDRLTTLTAAQDVSMPDIKDGLLGLRVAHELEMPSAEDRAFTDANGIVTTVKASEDKLPSGNYLTSMGKQGDSAWGTRANWCMLYGRKGKDTVSIVIIDHPKNTGYPTYWHARGYGLFAANPLGQKIFSNGKEALNLNLKKDAGIRLRYRVVINDAEQRLTNDVINKLAKEFAAMY